MVESHLKRGRWAQPQVAWFSGLWKDTDAHVTPDGKRIYFVSNRPTDGSSTPRKDDDIWYVDVLKQNDLASAAQESTALDASLWRLRSLQAHEPTQPHVSIPSDSNHMQTVPVMPDAEIRPVLQSLSIASLELRAGILLHRGRNVEEKTLYSEASDDERDLGYHEPPIYIRPVEETEGAALLSDQDYSGAELAFAAALEERPSSGLALFGLAEAERLAGNNDAAKRHYQEFLRDWESADPD